MLRLTLPTAHSVDVPGTRVIEVRNAPVSPTGGCGTRTVLHDVPFQWTTSAELEWSPTDPTAHTWPGPTATTLSRLLKSGSRPVGVDGQLVPFQCSAVVPPTT